MSCGEAKLAHNVLMRMIGLWNFEHCVGIDKFFASIRLFKKKLPNDTYTCGIVRPNGIGLHVLYNIKN